MNNIKNYYFSSILLALFMMVNIVDAQIISKGAEWKFLDDGSDQGTAWKETAFDDSSWDSGDAILGYGTINAGAVTTVISFGPDENDKYPTTYFRKTIDYTVGSEESYNINLLADDGAVIYANGTEIARLNMDAGIPLYSDYSSGNGNEDSYTLMEIPLGSLVEGTNVIAVEVHNTSATSSDLGFDMELNALEFATVYVITKGAEWKYLDDGSDQGIVWKETAFDDSSWSAGNAILGYGTINAGTIQTTISYGADPNDKYPTTYFRKTINYTKGSEQSYVINLLSDDGAVIYVNGTEIARLNMDAGTPLYSDYASGNGNENSYTEITDIPLSAFIEGTNVIAVEVHNVSASSSDLGLDMDIIASPNAANYVKHIRFGSTDDPLNGVTITWRGIGTADKIKWGYTASFEEGEETPVQRSNWTGYNYDFEFPVLTAGATVYYSIYDSEGTEWLSEKTYQVASDATDGSFSFTAFGDSRTNVDAWAIIAAAAEKNDFTLFLGDIVNDGDVTAEWDTWLEKGADFISNQIMYHTTGNHDYGSGNSLENFKDLFTLPGNEVYYSFTYGDAVFINLQSYEETDATQYAWLLAELEANNDKLWKFLFFHKPFYTSPVHMGEMDAAFDTWWQAFDDYGVDMIFNGHTHNYQRTKPINRNVSTTSPVDSYGSGAGEGRCQIVSGAAGAPLYGEADTSLWWLEETASTMHYCTIDIDGDVLSFKAIDAYQEVFDSFTIDKSELSVLENQVNQNLFSVYPNPVDGKINVKTNFDGEFSYTITNMLGKEMLTGKAQSKIGGIVTSIDIKNQAKGVYFIIIHSKDSTRSKKIIIK